MRTTIIKHSEARIIITGLIFIILDLVLHYLGIIPWMIWIPIIILQLYATLTFGDAASMMGDIMIDTRTEEDIAQEEIRNNRAMLNTAKIALVESVTNKNFDQEEAIKRYNAIEELLSRPPLIAAPRPVMVVNEDDSDDFLTINDMS